MSWGIDMGDIGHTDTRWIWSEVHWCGQVFVCWGRNHHRKAVKKLEGLRDERNKKATHRAVEGGYQEDDRLH